MVKQSIIKTAKKYLKAARSEMNVKAAYIFGSCAKGNQNDESDIDIAVVLKDMKDFFETQLKLMRLRRKIDLRIEPHPIADADFHVNNPFAKEVIETGILIH